MKRNAAVLMTLLLCASLLAAEQKTISFSADKMTGTSGKKNGTTGLEGNAKVSIGSLQISGDKIDLFGEDFRYVSASGNVSGVDTEKGFSFKADFLTYDRDLELASFKGNAKLTDSKHDVESSAGMITYSQKTEIAFLQIGVSLKRKEIACTSAFATYRRTVSLLDLSGSPLVIRSGDEFRADRISVNLETEYITLDGSVSGSLKDTKKEAPPAVPATVPADGSQPPGENPAGEKPKDESADQGTVSLPPPAAVPSALVTQTEKEKTQ